MGPEREEDRPIGALERRLWLAVFSVSGFILVACLVVFLGLRNVVAEPEWLFWLAIGVAVACTVAAIRLQSMQRGEAIGDAAAMIRTTSRSRNRWDDLGDLDD